MSIRKGSKVSHSIRGGLWEVIKREAPMSVFGDFRVTLRNVKTKEFIMCVRDKDIITKSNPRFDQFVQLGE